MYTIFTLSEQDLGYDSVMVYAAIEHMWIDGEHYYNILRRRTQDINTRVEFMVENMIRFELDIQ